MIERISGIGMIEFTCDACPEVLETDEYDFAEANAARKRAGWSAERVEYEWVHLCPACQERGDDFEDLS